MCYVGSRRIVAATTYLVVPVIFRHRTFWFGRSALAHFSSWGVSTASDNLVQPVITALLCVRCRSHRRAQCRCLGPRNADWLAQNTIRLTSLIGQVLAQCFDDAFDCSKIVLCKKCGHMTGLSRLAGRVRRINLKASIHGLTRVANAVIVLHMKYAIPMPDLYLEDSSEWVYVIQMGDDGPVKIGFTGDVGKRFDQLQSACPVTLHIRALFPCNSTIERGLHRRFIDHRMRGEWYLPHAEIWDYVSSLPGLDPALFPRKPPDDQARLKRDAAERLWHDPSLTMAEALKRMPGWAAHTAYATLGQRGAPRKMTKERARAMARKRWANAEPGTVARWLSPHMADKRHKWAQHWRDPKHGSERAAFDALPDEIKRDLGSKATARRIFNPKA